MTTEREFDLIIYGATGFTGRLVAEYLVGREGAPRWAMAGRSKAKLAQVRDEIGAPGDTPFVVADADDPGSLAAMAERARCIVTTVGPYALYGTPLVEACVAAGTDYTDLSGEVLWMHETTRRFGQRAAETGARIVHSTGFDSIPFDYGVFFLQQEAQKQFGSPCARVRGRVRDMRGTLSGGTAASGKETARAVKEDPSLMAHLLNPFSLSGDFQGPEQPTGAEVEEDPASGGWVAPFFMAPINTKNVHRSNMLLGHAYGEDFVYDEMFLTGPGENGRKAAEGLAAISQAMTGGGGKGGPKPGEGPSKAEREAGGYDVLFVGTHANGQTIKVCVTGDKDPGYGSTSKIMAEASICLIEDAQATAGGVWTPAAALGESLIPRLIDRAGLTFTVV
ncbi:MAG: trans-acting enoyl reductase family protein [Myxococcota bacterium]